MACRTAVSPAVAGRRRVRRALSSLETPSRTVFLGSLNQTTVKLQNRFDALRQDDDIRSQFGSIRSQFCLKPSAVLKSSTSKDVCPNRAVSKTTLEDVCSKGWVAVTKKRWPKKAKVELNNIERNVPDQVNNVNNSQFMEITVDSGAGSPLCRGTCCQTRTWWKAPRRKEE